MATIIKTIKPSGGDYVTLSTAHTDISNVVAGGDTLIWEVSGAITQAGTTISDTTLGPTGHLHILVKREDRATTSITASAAGTLLSVNITSASAPSVTVEGLELVGIGTVIATTRLLTVLEDGALGQRVLLKDVIVRNVHADGATVVGIYTDGAADNGVVLVNCRVYDITREAGEFPVNYEFRGDFTRAYNCIAYNGVTGFRTQTTTEYPLLVNCASISMVDAYAGTWHADSTNNAGSGTDTPGSNNQDSLTATEQWVDPANGDFTLKLHANQALKENGADWNSGIVDLKSEDGTFTRSSIAFVEDEDGFTEVAANEKREIPVAVAGAGDPVVMADVGTGGAGDFLRPMCNDGAALYAVSQGNSGVYRSTDGITWTKKSSVAIEQLFSLSSSVLLGTITAAGGDFLRYSTDSGATWTPSKWGNTGPASEVVGTSFSLSSTGATLRTWSVYVAGSTVIIAEYGSAESRYIYRSTDGGATISFVEDIGARPDGGTKQHFHKVIYHARQQRWVAVAGDGDNRQTVYSDDDGITWASLIAVDLLRFQPTQFVDVGDSDRLLFGSDQEYQIGWFNVVTGAISSAFIDLGSESAKIHIFEMWRSGGLTYAATRQGDAVTDYDPIVVVSDDHVRWIPYCRFAPGDQIFGLKTFAGEFKGRIYAEMAYRDTTVKYGGVSFKAATVVHEQGLLIEPACTNLLDANESSAETDDTGFSLNSFESKEAVAPATLPSLHGDNCLHYEDSSDTTAQGLSGNAAVTAGVYYQGVFWCNSPSAQRIEVGLQDNKDGSFSNLAVGNADIGPQVGGWRRAKTLRGLCRTGAPDADTMRFSWPVTRGGNADIDLELDAVILAAAPVGTWQVGGTARTIEKITWSKTLPANYTMVWSVLPLTASSDFPVSGGNYYVGSVVFNSNDYLELYWDATNLKWTVEYTDDGGTGSVTLATGALTFERMQSLAFAVSVGDGGIAFTAMVGGAPERLAGAAQASLQDAAATITSGDNAGANVFPHVLARVAYTDIYLGNPEAEDFANTFMSPFDGKDVNGVIRQTPWDIGPYSPRRQHGKGLKIGPLRNPVRWSNKGVGLR